MKSEMKMPRDRDREVKFLENSREILENSDFFKILIQRLFILQPFYSGMLKNGKTCEKS